MAARRGKPKGGDGGSAPERPTEMKRRGLKVAARVRRWVKRMWRAFSGMTLLLIAAVILLAQTARGHTIALDAAMSRAERIFAGDLGVEAVRSGTLLTGGTLAGVTLQTADARPFLSADSIQFRYSLINAVLGGPPVRSVVVWGLDLEISKYTRDQSMNVTELLAPEQPSVGPEAPSRPFTLGRVGLRESRVRVLLPGESGGVGTIEGPEGEPLRELAFDSLDVDLEETVLSPDDAIQFAARLASLSSTISVLEDPLRVEEAFGRVDFGAAGLAVTGSAFRMPGSLLRGEMRVGPEEVDGPWTFRSELRTDGWAELADLQWLDDRVPDGRFRGGARLHVADGVSVDLRDVEIELEASQLFVDGPVRFDRVMSFDALRVEANPLPLERLEPWLAGELPLDGWLSGEAVFSGTFRDLTAQGEVTLVPRGYGGRPSNADFSGTMHFGDNPGATDFRAEVQPFNTEVVEAVLPGFPWAGTGRMDVAIDGRADDEIRIAASIDHTSPLGLESAAGVDGTLYRGVDGAGLIAALDADLGRLAVGALSELAPDLGLRGVVSGPVRIDGPLMDLSVSSDLVVGGGQARVAARFDATRPELGYTFLAEATDLPVHALSAAVPDSTRWTGDIEVEGAGFGLDSLALAVTASADASWVSSVRVDSAYADVRVESGVLVARSLEGTVGGISFDAGGRLGLAEGRFGSANVDFQGPSLVGLRPILMGLSDTLLVQDSISPLEADLFRLSGIEPDTLPRAVDVRLEGEVLGSASVSGSIADLDLGVLVNVVGAAYRANRLDSAQVYFTATGLPELSGDWQVGVLGRGIEWEGRTFERGGFVADMFNRQGDGQLELVRGEGEAYSAAGTFAFDSVGGSIDLAQASIRVQEDEWALLAPSRVVWSPDLVEVDSLRIGRDGPEPMSLVAHGQLSGGGGSALSIDISGLLAEQVLHVAQIDNVDVGGRVDLNVDVRGEVRSPRIEADFRIDGGRYQAMQLSRLEGSIAYEERVANVEVEGWDGARRAITARGDVPIDLSFTRVEERVVDAPMDVRLAADSLDAAIALSFVTSLEEVLGTVSGEVWLGGTPRAPEPEGVVTLSGGEWSIEAIGVRHTEVEGELRLNRDRTVDVDLMSTGTGVSEVTGLVSLVPFSDPQLDLRFDLDGFQAVDRPDVFAIISGQFDLQGNYRRPLAQGSIVVDEGTIYVDELQRAAGVVDLADDSFLFDAGLGVDTTALVTQPLLAGFENPFFDNLRVNVEMSVPRGSWLRSLESDIELAGELQVLYDRSVGDFVLLGELDAVRGSHLVLGRSFDLQEGTVSFQGRPGLNPDLDIVASSRIRRPDEPAFDIDAAVTGPLLQPIVTLTTEESGLAEEDLVSYLLFGQPSTALGGRNAEGLAQVQNSSLARSAQGFAVTYLGGAFFNQLGNQLAQETDIIDYVSVQQSALQSLGADYVADTQLELGRYFGDDTFMVVVFRPPGAGAQDQDPIGGVRVEYALTEDYNVEGFFEDRFLRSGTQFFGASSGLLESERILGVLFFREWGFTPGQDGPTEGGNR